ncbi:exodeoxyribonuclease V subunit beta [Methyloprofundus sedimenti]|uniref:RecBCD enzyme subunit RecB n=1 Tax=Methyloprofundus sedimenti TaxID=1420851 RepID=A0A1V8M1K0_9GAMM|nr:exodeoxyribonuclease V subunit beta [Methyloprofundus sedimenti]OQK15439.1 exodeoxyribonuclease V subunit beta [Methyloprofundus sedimenti]
MPANHQDFNPVTTELKPGINLLEASAGTGKTYAIAMLALRFVVEQNYAIDQLLIVTFTKAATKELKERVRARLVEAKHYLTGQSSENIDVTISQWAEELIASSEIDEKLAIQRLNTALLSIDQAGIFTIHGFCQRLLKEHALESGQMFDVELSDETHAVRQQMVEDFWRTQIYPRDAWEVSLLCHQYDTPDALLASLGKYPATLAIYPELEDLDSLLVALKTQALAAKKALELQGESLEAAVNLGYFKKPLTDKFPEAYQSLQQWLQATAEAAEDYNCPCPGEADFKLFSSDNLAKEIRVAHKDKLDFDSSAFDLLMTYSQKVSLVLRRALAEELQKNLETRLQQLNIMSHDSLITRTADALSNAGGELLVAVISQQYRVALIDEFQDTDQNQWHIFSHLFAAPEQYLYLIGDPKQAIYKFRGADIHSYLQAKQQAQHHYTLGKNWRSHPDLVAAINQLFSQCTKPFVFEDLEFNPVEPALDSAKGTLVHNSQPLAPLALWQLAESDAKTGYWTNAKAADEVKIAITNEILLLLNGEVSVHSDTANCVLQAADIAILVRTNKQAVLYQEVLNLAGIPAVLNSTASVFSSTEARDLHQLMQALAQPGDMSLLKQALSLSWFALDGQQLYQTLNDEIQLGAWLSRFQDYHELWQKKGFMAMMLRFLSQENVRVHLTRTSQAERQITNLHHLLELVQQASLDEHLGLLKTIDWLRAAITAENNVNDEQQLRLESDADAVKIVTMHRSKGLEYPVVFCPYLWGRSDRLEKEKQIITCHAQDEMLVDLGSDNFEQHREIALQEELAEDLRILYVALTRAKYRCYVTWLDSRSSNKPNQSALAYLLYQHADIPFTQQQEKLQQLATDYPQSFAYQLLETGNVVQGTYQATERNTDLAIPAQKRHLYSNWQMSSYTALSYLSLHEAAELPLDKAEESNDTTQLAEQAPLALAKGAHTGNVIHDLLENISFAALARREEISQQRDSACQRYGLKIETPTILNELLYQTVTTPLNHDDSDFYLANLAEQSCLKEMPFYLSLSNFATEEINFILQDSPAFQPLSDKQMQGYLTGFIDLIFVYQGRYYVLDYKSNALSDYQPDTLTQAMREHNYGLQYWLYSVVLHQYLQKRLPDYHYAEHFGGVRYLFVRGMQAEQAMSGVYSDLPDEQRINELAELFSAG